MSPSTLPKFITSSSGAIEYKLYLEYVPDLADPDPNAWKYRVTYMSWYGILNIFEGKLLTIIETEIYDYCKKNGWIASL